MKIDNLVLKLSIFPTKLIGFNIKLSDARERVETVLI